MWSFRLDGWSIGFGDYMLADNKDRHMLPRTHFIQSSAIAANGESSKEKHVCGAPRGLPLLRHVS